MITPLGIIVAFITESLPMGLATMLFVGVAWMYPEWTLLGLIGAAPIMRSFNSGFLSPETIISWKMGSAILLTAVWSTQRIVSGEGFRFPAWLLLFFAGWFGLTVLTTLHALERGPSFDYLLLVASGVGLFGFSYHLDGKWQRRILGGALLIGGLLACVNLLQFLIMNHGVFLSLSRFVLPPRVRTYLQIYSLGAENIVFHRSSGSMGHPNQMGFYLGMLVPFAGALVMVKSLPKKLRIGSLVLFMLLLAGLTTTNSRGALLFTFCGLSILALHKGHRWLMVLGIGLALVTLAVYGFSLNKDGLLKRFSDHFRLEGGLSGRHEIWRNAKDMMGSDPLLGVGPGNFPFQYVSRFGYFTPNFAMGEQNEQIWIIQNMGEKGIFNHHAHSLYLQLLSELGWGGPLLFVGGVVLIIFHCQKAAARLPKYSLRRACSIAVAALAGAMLVYGWFDSQNSLIRSAMNTLIGPLLAVGLSASRLVKGSTQGS